MHLDYMGSTGFGHYICFVRDTKSNTWHEINDSKVPCCGARPARHIRTHQLCPVPCPSQISTVSKHKVLKQRAYMLFYERTGPQPQLERAEPLVFAEAGEDEAGAEGADDGGAKLCPGGCGFYGTPEKEGMCTQCWRKAKGIAAPAPAPVPAAADEDAGCVMAGFRWRLQPEVGAATHVPQNAVPQAAEPAASHAVAANDAAHAGDADGVGARAGRATTCGTGSSATCSTTSGTSTPTAAAHAPENQDWQEGV